MMRTADQRIRILELYAGIGGMRFGLEGYVSRIQQDDGSTRRSPAAISVTAVDISPHAKEVYDYNFPGEHSKNVDVRALRDEEFDVWLLTMSPPCQPFTRNGNGRDVLDFRCESFLHILERLERLDRVPQHIVMENVQGFETSDAHSRFIAVMRKRGYMLTEYLLNPVDFGYPNSRLRYYLTGKLVIPGHAAAPEYFGPYQPLMERTLRSTGNSSPRKTLQEYLLDGQPWGNPEVNLQASFAVPIETCEKYLMVMDVKHPESDTTNCFTSNYGRYLKGAGSVFCPLSEQEFEVLCRKYVAADTTEERRTCVAAMKLRYFTPVEVALLMGFPNSFRKTAVFRLSYAATCPYERMC
ncbi:hypothetical protein RvY_07784-2 [Ramazzottius varieornatus]|uniref:DNA methyltransferase 2 n=1 Tax=Ramazzottius varieornatus TaxID=947166 RepID=A0A1D1VBR8_RAMVA|nr:hypothetical protein RvY_07784-2 [Ramazzottius varieornatus]